MKLTYLSIFIFFIANILALKSQTLSRETIIKFDYKTKYILIDVYIENQNYKFCIDNNSKYNVLSPKLVNSLGLSIKEGEKIGTPEEGRKRIQKGQINEINISNKAFQNFEFISFDFWVFNELEIDGIIGYEFLKFFNSYSINYDKKEFILNPERSYETFEYEFDINLDGYMIVIEMYYNKKPIDVKYVGRMIMDTGYPMTMMVSKLIKKDDEMCNNQKEYSEYKTCSLEFEDSNFKPIDMENVIIPESKKRLWYGVNLLGNGFFQEYISYVDFKQKKLYLTRNSIEKN